MPCVSIIVPVYNVEKYLKECLDSIACQTLMDIEVICVNDGSTDGSLTMLEDYARNDSRFKVISKPNAGYGNTINRGIAAATGEYIGIVESDDFVEPEMFNRLYHAAKATDSDIVRCNYWLYWSKPEPRNEMMECFTQNSSGFVVSPRDLKECFYFPPALWSSVFRRGMIVENGLTLLETPGASYQDTAFSFKLMACAQRIYLIHDPYPHYRQDNEASSINNKAKAHFVRGEYAEIDRFIREDAKDESLLRFALRRKYDAYRWNLQRIDESLRLEFAQQAGEEFKQSFDNGELTSEEFSPREWLEIKVLVADPAAFVKLVTGEGPHMIGFFEKVARKIKEKIHF